jgi:hypothetical protein
MVSLVLLAALAASPSQTSASLLAFPQSNSYGLHACDPVVEPPPESHVFCVSAKDRRRTHRSSGDMIQGCRASGLKLATNGPPLTLDTELSFLVTRGSVADLACELQHSLGVLVTAQSDTSGLPLRNIRWRGVLRDAPEKLLSADDGSRVLLHVDYDKNTVSLQRPSTVDAEK